MQFTSLREATCKEKREVGHYQMIQSEQTQEDSKVGQWWTNGQGRATSLTVDI